MIYYPTCKNNYSYTTKLKVRILKLMKYASKRNIVAQPKLLHKPAMWENQ